MQLLNRRQLEKLKEKWWKRDEYDGECEKQEDQADGISIQNIGGVFIVIFVGIGMAFITLLFEYYWYKYRKNPSNVIEVAEANQPKKQHDAFAIHDTHKKNEKEKEKEDTTLTLRTRHQTFVPNFKGKF